MSSSLTTKELIILIARRLSDAVEGVTKSKEVLKDFSLIATKIQNETGKLQKEIIWTASTFFVDEWNKKKRSDNENEVKKLMSSSLNKAYNIIKEEKNAKR